MRPVGAGGDEPDVDRVLAQIAVVHAGLGADRARHLVHAMRRGGDRGERAGRGGIGAAGAADAADRPGRGEPFEAHEHLALAEIERGGDGGEGPRHQGQVALPPVQKGAVDRIEPAMHGHSPVRWARAVKKMPEGLSAGISPSFWKVVVS